MPARWSMEDQLSQDWLSVLAWVWCSVCLRQGHLPRHERIHSTPLGHKLQLARILCNTDLLSLHGNRTVLTETFDAMNLDAALPATADPQYTHQRVARGRGEQINLPAVPLQHSPTSMASIQSEAHRLRARLLGHHLLLSRLCLSSPSLEIPLLWVHPCLRFGRSTETACLSHGQRHRKPLQPFEYTKRDSIEAWYDWCVQGYWEKHLTHVQNPTESTTVSAAGLPADFLSVQHCRGLVGGRKAWCNSPVCHHEGIMLRHCAW